MNKMNRALAFVATAAVLGLAGVLALAPRTPPAAPDSTVRFQGDHLSQWSYGTEVDQMRGLETRIARLQSNEPIETRWGPESIWLTVSAGDANAVLITSDALATCGRTTIVEFRIDDGPVEHAECLHFDSSQARGTAWLVPFAIDAASGRPIPPRLRLASRMTVEVPTLDGPVQVTFNVEDLVL